MPSPAERPTLSWARRWTRAAAPPLAVFLLKTILATCRLEIRNGDYFEEARRSGKVMVACWHETLGTALWYYRDKNYITLASQSSDGELAARAAERFGFCVVRGSSTRGGYRALTELRKALEHSAGLGFTVDGPKGPPRVAKVGIAILAARTGLPIVPNVFSVLPAWRLHSWDRHTLPKPFGHVICAYGEPVPPPADLSRPALEATRLEIERRLNELQDALDAAARVS